MPLDKNQYMLSGRLSYPSFTMEDAIALNEKSDPSMKKPEDKVTPVFNVLLNQQQYDKFKSYILDSVIPFLKTESRAAQKLPPAQLKKFHAGLDKIAAKVERDDFDPLPPYTPFRAVRENTMELAPETVASVPIKGTHGQDITQLAVVRDEAEAPLEELDKLPALLPISKTIHELYGGCNIKAQVRLNGSDNPQPWLSVYSNSVIFSSDNESFSKAGSGISEDDVFMDED